MANSSPAGNVQLLLGFVLYFMVLTGSSCGHLHAWTFWFSFPQMERYILLQWNCWCADCRGTPWSVMLFLIVEAELGAEFHLPVSRLHVPHLNRVLGQGIAVPNGVHSAAIMCLLSFVDFRLMSCQNLLLLPQNLGVVLILNGAALLAAGVLCPCDWWLWLTEMCWEPCQSRIRSFCPWFSKLNWWLTIALNSMFWARSLFHYFLAICFSSI